MATRPAYLIENGKVIRKDYDFTWYSGLSSSRKQKCGLSLHETICETLTADEIQQIRVFSHFTDIEFNPAKSINTQGKTAAEIRLMLDLFGETPEMTPDEFLQFHKEYVLA